MILIVIVMEMQEKLPVTNLVQSLVVHGDHVIGLLVQTMSDFLNTSWKRLICNGALIWIPCT